jgi:hypothetical protein
MARPARVDSRLGALAVGGELGVALKRCEGLHGGSHEEGEGTGDEGGVEGGRRLEEGAAEGKEESGC